MYWRAPLPDDGKASTAPKRARWSCRFGHPQRLATSPQSRRGIYEVSERGGDATHTESAVSPPGTTPCVFNRARAEGKPGFLLAGSWAGLRGTSPTSTGLLGRKQCCGEAPGQSCRSVVLCLLQIPELLKLQNILMY